MRACRGLHEAHAAAVAAAAAAGTGAVENMNARALLIEEIDQEPRACDVTARGAQGLAERAHLDLDLGR